MADLKYGRLFTTDDVHKIIETALENALVDQPDAVIEHLDETGELKFRKDEPVFVLRGQDAAAYGAIDEYRFAISQGFPDFNGKDHEPASDETQKQVQSAVDIFGEYASSHPDVMKVAD